MKTETKKLELNLVKTDARVAGLVAQGLNYRNS
jgi:hypothetical protein